MNVTDELSLQCVGCGENLGEVHGPECSIGYILEDIITKDDCFPGEE